MVFLKLLSLGILIFIGYWLSELGVALVKGFDLDPYFFTVPIAFSAFGCMMCFPKVLRALARLFSTDLTYWEETRNELTVVENALMLFGLIWLYKTGELVYYGGGPEILQTAPGWVNVVLFLVGCVLVGVIGETGRNPVANLFGIEYPNALRIEAEKAMEEAQETETDVNPEKDEQ